MVTTRRQTKAVALASSDDEVADWGAGDMPAELLEKIAACVLNEELATFCAVSHAYSAGASAVVYARILNLVLLANDMQPGHNNPAWTSSFAPPPPVVSVRLPNLVRVDLSAASLDKIGHGCFRTARA